MELGSTDLGIENQHIEADLTKTCRSSPGLCNFVTEDCIQGQSLGKYVCRCKKGFTRSGDGVCTDIDECISNNNPCDSLAECKNTQGSYECICPQGYETQNNNCEDIDECAAGMDNCHRDAVCINNIGSFSCLCKAGFLHYKNGRLCLKEQQENSSTLAMIILACMMFAGLLGTIILFNLCSVLSTNPYNCNCKMHWFITEVRLNYTKVKEKVGYLKDMRCDKPARLHRKRIYKLNVSDVCPNGVPNRDECKLQLHECHQHADCRDLPRSYSCSCRPGFTGNGKSCSDIDECSEGTATCPRLTVCNNTESGYNCTCKAGYVKDDTEHCVKKEMCSGLSNPCDRETEECFEGESLGNYVCRCKEGFKLTNNGLCEAEESKLEDTPIIMYIVAVCVLIILILAMIIIIICLIGVKMKRKKKGSNNNDNSGESDSWFSYLTFPEADIDQIRNHDYESITTLYPISDDER
ncbi:signal peptide, CUB and EGF-like domain-containing protein 3 [Xenia sp. Carnegie-2017]|uniref:signal peptide, CUB and EGF-like domain-containing protein 3 n=1 Tax=Xenia sp. Carnegie-2017 TaxID=2897299 RepID=UPI001F040A4B|nr:signal peptide, CUB and EGF-like domain-containing protein 3 [Xenia sp. Carnegie-2017]